MSASRKSRVADPAANPTPVSPNNYTNYKEVWALKNDKL